MKSSVLLALKTTALFKTYPVPNWLPLVRRAPLLQVATNSFFVSCYNTSSKSPGEWGNPFAEQQLTDYSITDERSQSISRAVTHTAYLKHSIHSMKVRRYRQLIMNDASCWDLHMRRTREQSICDERR